MLAHVQGAVTFGLIEAMQHKLVDCNNFVIFRKSTAIVLSLWERAYRKLYNQTTGEWTLDYSTDHVDYQLKAALTFEGY